MTLSDLARLTNFSVSTVSKAFTNAEDISEEAREIIFATAKQYGVFGKYYKGKYSKKTVAIICPEFFGDYYVMYLETLKKILEDNGFMTVISSYDFSREKQEELVDYYSSYVKVDAMIIFYLCFPLKKGCTIPTVSIGGIYDNTNVDCISVDLATPIGEIISHFKELGHKKIGFVGEKLTVGKRNFFIDAMKKHQLEIVYDYMITTDERLEKAGEEGAEKLCSLKDMPTAVLCAYDVIASGFIKTVTEKGYTVPGDFSVVGIDNILASEYIGKSLTTIDDGVEESCRMAMELIMKKLSGDIYSLKKNITIQGKVIYRGTTAENQPSIG